MLLSCGRVQKRGKTVFGRRIKVVEGVCGRIKGRLEPSMYSALLVVIQYLCLGCVRIGQLTDNAPHPISEWWRESQNT